MDGPLRMRTVRVSTSHQLPAPLVEQPVVNVASLAVHLGITSRAARSVIEKACERGILAKMSNAERGAFFQAPDLIAVLEETSGLDGIRRIAARQRRLASLTGSARIH